MAAGKFSEYRKERSGFGMVRKGRDYFIVFIDTLRGGDGFFEPDGTGTWETVISSQDRFHEKTDVFLSGEGFCIASKGISGDFGAEGDGVARMSCFQGRSGVPGNRFS